MTSGSAGRDFRLIAELRSVCPELGFGLGTDLEDISDGIFSLGLDMEGGDKEDDGLEDKEELPVDSLETGLGSIPELWRASEESLVLGEEAEVGLGVDLGRLDDTVIPGLDMGLLVGGLTVQLYELRLGSLYRSTVSTFP